MRSKAKKESQESSVEDGSRLMFQLLPQGRRSATRLIMPVRMTVVIVIAMFALSSGTGFASNKVRPDEGPWKSYRTNDDYKLQVNLPPHWSVTKRGEQQLVIWGSKQPFTKDFSPLEEIPFLPPEQRPKDYGALKINLVSGVKESLGDYASYVIRYSKLHAEGEGEQSKGAGNRWYFTSADIDKLECKYEVLEGVLFVCLDASRCERAKVGTVSKTVSKIRVAREASSRPLKTCKVAVVTAYRDPFSSRKQQIEAQLRKVLSGLRQY